MESHQPPPTPLGGGLQFVDFTNFEGGSTQVVELVAPQYHRQTAAVLLPLLTLLTAAIHSDKAGRKSKYVLSEQICVFVQLVVDESEPFR